MLKPDVALNFISYAGKASVEPMFDQYKPPFISKMGFQKLTFGEAPIKIDSVKIDPKAQGKVVMEIDFRWQGDANISLFIQLSGLSAIGGYSSPCTSSTVVDTCDSNSCS